jgi:flagellar motor switch protein FliM
MADSPEDTGADDAAEWEKMLAEGDKSAAANAEGETAARVLNQDEIDLLLGFDNSASAVEGATGIYAILDKSMMAYEKLPMIEVVFDRMVRMLSSSLRNFTADNVDLSLESMQSQRFDDYLNSIPLPAMLNVFRAVEWENFGIITIDSSMIYSTVDILLGGRRSTRKMRVEGRPYTTIEQDIIKKMCEVVLNDMSASFDPISPVTFAFERLESNPRFATIARPNSAVLVVKLRVDMDERGGMIEIMLPHATLEPIRDLLLQMFMGERFGQDSVWERHWGREVGQTYVDVEAILDEIHISLGEVVDLKIGSTILLNANVDDPIVLKCGGVEITTGRLGRVGDAIAVALNEEIPQYRLLNKDS